MVPYVQVITLVECAPRFQEFSKLIDSRKVTSVEPLKRARRKERAHDWVDANKGMVSDYCYKIWGFTRQLGERLNQSRLTVICLKRGLKVVRSMEGWHPRLPGNMSASATNKSNSRVREIAYIEGEMRDGNI